MRTSNRWLTAITLLATAAVAAPASAASPAPASASTAVTTTSAVRPTAATTGVAAGVTLTPMAGGTITASGLIENKVINGNATFTGHNLTLRNVRVTGSAVFRGDNLVLQTSEFGGMTLSGTAKVRATGLDLFGTLGKDGLHVTSDTGRASDVVIENTWIHNPVVTETAHYDGIQVRGVDGLTLRGLSVELGAHKPQYNAALFLENANGGNSNITVDSSWILGGGYEIYTGATNVKIANTVFDGGRWGHLFPQTSFGAITSFVGNRELDGTPLKYGTKDGKPAFVVDTTAPATPAPVVMSTVAPTVSATADGDRITVAWTAVAEAVAYEIWETGTVGAPVTTVAAPTLSRTSGALAVDGRGYTYSVRAVSATGVKGELGVASTIVLGGTSTTTTPAPAPAPVVMSTVAPTVSATADVDRITVAWTAVDKAVAYEIWETGTVGAPVTTVAAPTLSRTSGALAVDGRGYTYSVRAVSETGVTGEFGAAATIVLGGTSTTTTPAPAPEPAPEPAPAPAPEPAPEPAPAPSTGGKPTPTSTGVLSGAVLAPMAGGWNKAAGTVIENKVINGDVTFAGGDLTLRNVRVTGVAVFRGDNLVIQDSEFGGVTLSGTANVQIRRADMFGVSGKDGLHITSDTGRAANVLIEDSLVRNPVVTATSHYDGLQVRGVTGLTLRRVSIDLGAYVPQHNAAVFLQEANGGNSDITVASSWLNGGGFTLSTSARNLKVTDTVFGGGRYNHLYPKSPLSSFTAFTGNTSGAGALLKLGTVNGSSMIMPV